MSSVSQGLSFLCVEGMLAVQRHRWVGVNGGRISSANIICHGDQFAANREVIHVTQSRTRLAFPVKWPIGRWIQLADSAEVRVPNEVNEYLPARHLACGCLSTCRLELTYEGAPILGGSEAFSPAFEPFPYPYILHISFTQLLLFACHYRRHPEEGRISSAQYHHINWELLYSISINFYIAPWRVDKDHANKCHIE